MSFDSPSSQTWPPKPRGYFAIGAERMSKALNLGNLMRSAHAFGASFTFTIGATYQALEAKADTSKGRLHVPHYDWAGVDAIVLPAGCKLVGIELIEEAPARGSLSATLLERCDFTVKIPTTFCVNVAIAGAIVMYDRMKSLAQFADRPLTEGAQGAKRARGADRQTGHRRDK
jgi:hypothetical protein